MAKITFKRPAKRIPAFDMEKLNNRIAQIRFEEINDQSFDGKNSNRLLIDEAGCWESRPFIPGEIKDVTNEWLAKRSGKSGIIEF